MEDDELHVPNQQDTGARKMSGKERICQLREFPTQVDKFFITTQLKNMDVFSIFLLLRMKFLF